MEMGQPSAAEAVGVFKAVTIAKRYAIMPVLEGVDCSRHPGRIQTVIGENGAGRSTLFKILSDLFPPTGGALHLDGEPLILASSRTARQWGVCLAPQEPAELAVAETMFGGQLPNGGGAPFRRQDWAAALRRGPQLRGGFASGLSSTQKPAGTVRRKWTPFSILATNSTQFDDDSADLRSQTTALSLRSSRRSVRSSVQRPRKSRVFRNRASRRSWTAALLLRNERGNEELGRRDMREERSWPFRAPRMRGLKTC